VGQDGVDPRNRFDIARAIQRTCRGGPRGRPATTLTPAAASSDHRAAMMGMVRADDGFAAPRHCEAREACRSNIWEFQAGSFCNLDIEEPA
jgi:hypothetical protein